MSRVFVGTAGWSIHKDYSKLFRAEGSHLERYSDRFNAVEVNSSFYKNHQPKTYARWAQSVPADFKFSVKLLKLFTHERKLSGGGDELKQTLDGIQELGDKLGVLLVQLPPKQQFAPDFFEELRELFTGNIACEPRHISWSTKEARDFFIDLRITKVCADPEPCPHEDPRLITAGGFAYHRWHGSPVIYRSKYEREDLDSLTQEINVATSQGADAWCIFDNTTFGHASENASDVARATRPSPS